MSVRREEEAAIIAAAAAAREGGWVSVAEVDVDVDVDVKIGLGADRCTVADGWECVYTWSDVATICCWFDNIESFCGFGRRIVSSGVNEESCASVKAT